MKILCIGDTHFKTDNVIETDKFIFEIECYLQKNIIDIIVVMGDILHTHEKLHTIALNSAFKFFKMLIKYSKVYCLVGNHDFISNTIFLEDKHWLNILKEWKNITIVDTIIKTTIDQYDFYFCPYIPDGRFIEALNLTHSNEWKSATCIFAHQLLDGAKMGPIIANGVEKWDDKFPLCFSGHIHDKQKVQHNLIYVGSSTQQAFGESEDKCLLELDYNGIDIYPIQKEVYLQIKLKKLLYVDLKDVSKALSKLENNDLTSNEYKIVLKGTTDEIKAFKKTNDCKRLESIDGVKALQFKSSTDHINKRANNTNSFVDLLSELVLAEDNPYLTSMMSSMINGTEDISDKDIMLI